MVVIEGAARLLSVISDDAYLGRKWFSLGDLR